MKVASTAGLTVEDAPSSRHRYGCEWPQCNNRAQLKLSIDTGEQFCYCYRCSLRYVKSKFREIVNWNKGLYVQKFQTKEEIAENTRKAREI